MEERVRITITDGVADVRLSRPDKMNALDVAMFEGIVAAGKRLIDEPGLRAVVLSGEGRAFCAGLDMGRFQGMAATTDAAAARETNQQRLGPRTHGLSNGSQYAAMVWQDVPVPVIAAVHGVAFGGGFQVMLGADMRFIAPDTKLSVLEVKWGLVPDMGGFALMPRLARADVIRELTYSGRIFSGAEALALGFATRVSDDPHAEAMALAREIAGRNPHTIRADKRLLRLSEAADIATVLQAESDEQIALLGSPNQRESVRAALEKRDPKFIDPAPGE
ncbi:MAG: crotonase/enoyl-CoA hydratase family protein [Burkholderiaceae bacterium]